MADNIDAQLNAYLNLELPLDDLAEEPDAITEFIEASKLAGKVGWATAEGIARETTRIEKTIHRREAAPAPSPDPQRLAKRDEMVGFYENWLSTQMTTLGKSSADVISDWETQFPEASADVRAALQEAAKLVDAA